MYKFSMVIAVTVIFASSSFALTFSDDFNDDDISDWEARGASANWSASDGMVNGSTGNSPALLVSLAGLPITDGEVTVSATGEHAFGICTRLDEDNNGIAAYVSPDNNVARIRQIVNGSQGPALNTFNHDFPSGVMYNLTLLLDEGDVTFQIEVPSSGDSWSFSATDPSPHSGQYGLMMGDEPSAHWDWIEVQGDAEGNTDLTWFITDDQSMGDGDFCLELGETIQLSAELTNFSDFSLFDTFGILQSLSPYVEVTSNYVEYGELQGMSSSYGNGSFSVLASPAATEGEVYDMRLTVMASEGYLEQINFSLPVGAGLATDLESDSYGWSSAVAFAGWENDWHVSASRNHTPGGQFSFKCGSTGTGDYSNHHYGYLTSPYFNIPLSGECTFWSWIEAQILSSSVALDGGIVQYRRMDEWIDLFPVPAYSHQITEGSTGPFPDGTPVYSGTAGWTEYSMIFPDSLAGPGAIRFVFGSDDAGNREGWYIDDFLVNAPGSVEEGSRVSVQQPYLSVSENPFSEAVTFSCFSASAAGQTIEIRDICGRIVEELSVPGAQNANTIVWETVGVPSGIYFAGVSGSEASPVKLVKF